MVPFDTIVACCQHVAAHVTLVLKCGIADYLRESNELPRRLSFVRQFRNCSSRA